MKITTFINIANLDKILYNKVYINFDYIHSDGFLLTCILNNIFNKNIKRKSFDYTSIARKVLFSQNFNSILFCGGSKNDIENFKKNVLLLNKKKAIFVDGYISQEELITHIINNKPECVVLSLGAGLQERMALDLKDLNLSFIKNVYTSGAFISQTAENTYYYPKLINKLNLRWLYRAIKSKHVRMRLFKEYPTNLKYILNNYKKLKNLAQKIS